MRETNATLDEISGQSAEMIDALKRNNSLLESLGLGSGGTSRGGFNLNELARV